ncbi:MAG: hypothetical protein LRY48_09645 [Bacteroides graminisolvens]|nr:hypothetical protein [Bacteroides graminisolvens]
MLTEFFCAKCDDAISFSTRFSSSLAVELMTVTIRFSYAVLRIRLMATLYFCSEIYYPRDFCIVRQSLVP